MKRLRWVSLGGLILVPLLLMAAAWPKVTPAVDETPVERGKALFLAYKCLDCHGDHGQGTDDGPPLATTQKSAKEIADFLVQPSARASDEGMPNLTKDSPDIAPLVAFVLSLKK